MPPSAGQITCRKGLGQIVVMAKVTRVMMETTAMVKVTVAMVTALIEVMKVKLIQ